MRCMMEARLAGRVPVAVTHYSDTLDQAVAGSAHKLSRLIGSIIGRQKDRKLHARKEELLSELETEASYELYPK